MNNLIFDRTQLDIDNDTEKGQYTYTDLNRVESWCKYIADVLNNYNYYVSINTRTDWKESDYHYSKDLERIRTNINRLKEAYFSFTQIPENLEYMTINKANDIERILFEIDKIIGCMENNFIYCGVSNCGQNRVWQQRFRKPKTWISQPYKLSQYADTDTLKTIATESNKSIESSTEILGLTEIDKRDDVFASIESTNNSMQILDDLVGVEYEYYFLRNIIDDSSFENNKWNGANYSTSEKLYGNRSLYFPTGTTFVPNIEIERPIVGHVYYGRRYIKTSGNNAPADCRFEVWGADGENVNWVYAWNQGDYPEWGFDSAIHEITAIAYDETTRTIIRCFNVNTTADTWVDGLMLIDLTEAFGVGKEPTKEWCDVNIPYFDYITTIKIRKENS